MSSAGPCDSTAENKLKTVQHPSVYSGFKSKTKVHSTVRVASIHHVQQLLVPRGFRLFIEGTACVDEKLCKWQARSQNASESDTRIEEEELGRSCIAQFENREHDGSFSEFGGPRGVRHSGRFGGTACGTTTRPRTVHSGTKLQTSVSYTRRSARLMTRKPLHM